jgi:ectoine hydroxylase-related dioxygenase (phytanoyl-CoA dioxygenase family)
VLTVENQAQYYNHYDLQGYFVLRNYFNPAEIAALRTVILKFHQAWKLDNAEFYQQDAFNSSLITAGEYLGYDDRVALFNFISSKKMMDAIETVIPQGPAFMNTQLFFNPVNPQLKDFWHRDCQYDHDIEGQNKAIFEPQPLHLRVPLFAERGMEFVPGSHQRWDTKQELAVREELNGRLSNEDLPNSKKIALNAGDLLVFSAELIHRGLYGMDRLALDTLVFETGANFVDYVDDDCLPEASMLDKIDDPRLFSNIINLKSKP